MGEFVTVEPLGDLTVTLSTAPFVTTKRNRCPFVAVSMPRP